MPEHAVTNPTDAGTFRPDTKPLKRIGVNFHPIQLDDFDFAVHLPKDYSRDDPISLFTWYYNEDIIDVIVLVINSY